MITAVKQEESFSDMESTEHVIKEEILTHMPDDGLHNIKLEVDQVRITVVGRRSL